MGPTAVAPPGIAEATWLKAGAAEVQPSGTDNAPSEAARPTFAFTAPPKSGEPRPPAPEPHPLPSADSNAGSWLPTALVPDRIEDTSDTTEFGVEMLAVDIDADEESPEARLVPELSTVVEDVTAVAVVRDDNGDDDETEVAADASPCSALGIAAGVSGVDRTELIGDKICMPVPAVVPATCVAAAARPLEPAELVVCSGAANGVSADATDDAPA